MTIAGTGIAMAVLLFAAGCAVAALFFVLRERFAGGDRQRMQTYRDVFEPLFADLWSDEMHRRLTALFVAQRIAKSKSSARGLANVLISFIRRRLASEAEAGQNMEDVRLALTILGTKSVRQAQAESGQNIDLGNIHFRGAALFGVNLAGFRLAQCNFDSCQLANAKLSGTDLSGASLRGANLNRTDLRNADLSEADLSEADLTGARVAAARFTNTNISGAILAEAIGMTQEQLDEAYGDSGTAVSEKLRFVPGRAIRRPAKS